MPTAAVVGSGFIGPVHIEALRRLGVRVKGILGSSAEKSQTAARDLGLEIGYPNYDALIADGEIDVVHIASPNRLHAAMAEQALLAGKHVVCEKPLGMTSAETARLVELAQSRPRQIAAVNYNVRFYPLALEARAMIARGDLGRIYSVRGAYVQDWLLYETDWNWRVDPVEGGELRAVGDIGTHWMDLIGFVTGLQPESLLADLQTCLPTRVRPRGSVETFSGKPQEGDRVPVATEDWGSVLFHYAGGARGSMNVSQVTAGRKNRITFEIAGEKAALAWDSERPNELWIGRRGRPSELLLKDPALLDESVRPFANYPGGHNEGFPDTFKQLYRAVYGRLDRPDSNELPLYATFADGHRELQLCEAILASHRQRAWVSV
jgi:predicted dehydrogenase